MMFNLTDEELGKKAIGLGVSKDLVKDYLKIMSLIYKKLSELGFDPSISKSKIIVKDLTVDTFFMKKTDLIIVVSENDLNLLKLRWFGDVLAIQDVVLPLILLRLFPQEKI